MYKQIRDDEGNISTTIIQRIADKAFIPMVEANRDYQEYLEWVAAGNTPEPADE